MEKLRLVFIVGVCFFGLVLLSIGAGFGWLIFR